MKQWFVVTPGIGKNYQYYFLFNNSYKLVNYIIWMSSMHMIKQVWHFGFYQFLFLWTSCNINIIYIFWFWVSSPSVYTSTNNLHTQRTKVTPSGRNWSPVQGDIGRFLCWRTMSQWQPTPTLKEHWTSV